MKNSSKYSLSHHFIAIIFLIIQSTGAELSPSEYKLCPSGENGRVPPVDSVDVTGCSKAPCPLPRGKNSVVQIVFTADDDYPQVVNWVQGELGGMRKGFPGIDGKNACDKLYLMPDRTKVNCPLEKGKQYLYEVTLPIKSFFPVVTFGIFGGLKEKTSKKFVTCFEGIGKIV